VKTYHCTRQVEHYSTTDPPRGGIRRVSYLEIPRIWPYPVPVDPPRPVLDPASTNCRSTKKQGLHATGSEVFSLSHPLRHHGVRGWPAIFGARHYSAFHSARQNFTSKASLASLPPLDPIKGQAGDSTNGRRTSKNQSPSQCRRSTSQAISFVLSLFLSETWDWLPLLQLVTPTQALRCKEIQYFLPLDVGPSFA
jgi:hypothetical protein